MLQHLRPISPDRPNFSPPEFSSPAELLDSFVHFLRQQSFTIFATTVLTILIGGGYLALARSSYTATASMLIDTRKPQFFQQQPSNSDPQVDFPAVESQIRVLKSDNVALSVIKTLRLYEDPEFIGSASKGVLTSDFDILRRALGNFIKGSRSEDDAGSGYDAVRRTLGNLIEPSLSNDRAPAEYDATRRALDTFETRLNVTRDGLSYVIAISFRSYDAEKAANIANAIVNAYIVNQLDAKYQSTLRASNWLEDRIRELREQASAGEQAVVDYQREHNIVVDAAGKSTSDQRVAELNSQLIIVRAQTAEARARLDRIQTVLSSDPAGTLDATVTDTLKNDVVTRLRNQYLDLARKETDWAARYGHDHLAVVNLRNQKAEIRSAIVDELRRLAETYKSDFAIAKERANDVQKEYDQAVGQAERNNQAHVVLSDLESKSKTLRALYENFLQRYMESVQQQSFAISEAQLISPALRPLHKSSPKTFLTLAITACAGVILGFVIGMLRDLWDRVFRTTEQAEKILRAPCITLVPLLKSTARAPPSREGSSPSPNGTVPNPPTDEEPSSSPTPDGGEASAPASLASLGAACLWPNNKASSPRTLARNNNALWTTVDFPFSPFAESIRVIKVAVDLAEIVRANKVIGFTSSLPNEGKSTLAASLALLTAQAGRSVILVDGDLRNPTLTQALAPSAQAGIIEVISEKAAIEDVIWWSDPKVNLSFLPAVMKSRVAHTNEILASDATKTLFDDLRQRYEYIIVDLSPLAPVVDVRTTTHFIDSYVCVIQWGSTKIDVVKRALADAPGIYEKLIGTVLNKADISKLSRYDAHRGEYYSNKHYGRYGHAN